MMYFSRIKLAPDFQHAPALRRLICSNSYSSHQLLWDLFPKQKERPFIFREEIAGEQLNSRPDIKGEPIYYLVSKVEPQDKMGIFSIISKKYTPILKKGDCLAIKLRANPVVARKKGGKKNSVRHDIVMDSQKRLLHELARQLGTNKSENKSVLKNEILATWKKKKNKKIDEILRNSIRSNEKYVGLLELEHSAERLLYWAMKASTDNALKEWFISKGIANGFTILQKDSFQAEGYRWHALPRKGKTAGFSTVDFDGKIEVLDPDQIIQGLYHGIGPAKGFGCGLMMVRRI